MQLPIKAQQAIKIGLEKYNYLMSQVNNSNLAENELFQRKFKHFYRVRRTEVFCEPYFRFMEENKEKGVSFVDTLSHLYQKFGRIEPSFSSKLVATLNPHMPVWDKFVLQKIGLKAPSLKSNNRLEAVNELYNYIIQHYKILLSTQESIEMLNYFDELFPNENGLTDIKKIDLMYWQSREN